MHTFEMVRLIGKEALQKPAGYDKTTFIATGESLSLLGKFAFWFINVLYRYDLLVK